MYLSALNHARTQIYSNLSQFTEQSSAQYEVNYEVELDYKQNYAPRAFFQESASQPIEVCTYSSGKFAIL